MQKLGNLPGVESVGATTSLPATDNIGVDALILEGEPEPKHLQDARMMRHAHDHARFPRDRAHPVCCAVARFTAADSKDAPRVALIDEEAARTLVPKSGSDRPTIPLTRQPGEEPKWATIIGIVRPVIYDRIVRQRIYPGRLFRAGAGSGTLHVGRAAHATDPKNFVNRGAHRRPATNKDVPIYRIATMDEVVAKSFWDQRFFSSLFTIFAGLALFLASLGLYGVMDYSVRQRTQEIGVRMALGAQAGDVLRMITAHGMRLIGLGLVVGFVGAYLPHAIAGQQPARRFRARSA